MSHRRGCRYLTKIADQVVALISEKHANSIVWAEESQDASMDVDTDDESDRLFTFQVAKTHEQEENVKCRTGFKVNFTSTKLEGKLMIIME